MMTDAVLVFIMISHYVVCKDYHYTNIVKVMADFFMLSDGIPQFAKDEIAVLLSRFAYSHSLPL